MLRPSIYTWIVHCKALRHLAFLSIALLLSPFCIAEQFSGLKVHGDYKKLTPLVAKVGSNKADITEDDLLRIAKIKLMKEGINPVRSESPYHYLWVELLITGKGTKFSLELSLKKSAQAYGHDYKVVGGFYKPPQGTYGSIGDAKKNKKFILKALDKALDKFLFDYIDSNT